MSTNGKVGVGSHLLTTGITVSDRSKIGEVIPLYVKVEEYTQQYLMIVFVEVPTFVL